MANRTLGTNISLSGEKEYKKAISEINAGLGVLNSEMKKTTAQFQDNADSVEALTKKGDVLERKLSSQKEKVETLKEALANAAKEYGESDKRTMSYAKQLNEAETAVFNTEAAIRENNDALKESQEATDEATNSLADMANALGIRLPDGAQKALSGIKGFSAGAVAATAAVVAGVVGIIDAYKKLIDLTTEAASNADNILTLSQITGLDTDTIQELQYASELIDVSFETIQSSLAKLTNNMADAANGTGAASEALKKLGVDVTDSVTGELRSAETVFGEVIDALGRVGNETERNAHAMDIFGESAENLNPLIKQGSKVLQEYQKEAHNVGTVLSGEQLSALGAVDDAYQRLQKTQEGIKQQISAEFAPAVEKFYTAWTRFMQEAGEALINSGIIDNLGLILQNFTSLIGSFTDAENKLPGLTGALSAVSAVLGGIAQFCAVIADAKDAISSLLTLNFSGVKDALGFGYGEGRANNYQRTVMQQNGSWDMYNDFYTANAPGDMNFVGGRTKVGENGEETVFLPPGSQIMNAQDTRNSGGDIINVTIDARSVQEFNDIIRIAKSAKTRQRMMG